MTDLTDDCLHLLIPAAPGLVLLLLDDVGRFSHTAPVVAFTLVRGLDGQRTLCPYALINGQTRLWVNEEGHPLDDCGEAVYGCYRAHEAASIIEEQYDPVGEAAAEAALTLARARRDAFVRQAMHGAATATEHPQDGVITGAAKARAIIAAAQARTPPA